MADVIEQDNLAEIKGIYVSIIDFLPVGDLTLGLGRRPVRMPEVFVRPALDGKRLAGDLEIHSNGLRYSAPTGHKIGALDWLFI